MSEAEDRQPGARRVPKSPEAFRTISEGARDLDVPQHVLRFWESKFTQLRPLKRGGGRRYYRPEDVTLLRGIRQLLYTQGYTIKGVQRLLKENGVRFVLEAGREAGDAVAASPPAAAAAAPAAATPAVPTPAAPTPAAPVPGASADPAGNRRRVHRVIEELRAIRALLDRSR